MSATIVASSTKAVPHVVSSIQNIPLAKIPESKTNLRRLFDEAKLAELMPSIRCKGVLLPLLARPVNGDYEIIAGTQRFHAAQRAGLHEVPARVSEFTDAEAQEAQLIELSGVRKGFL
jgi:ParB family chromosome partitioning protein